jgi:serine/threonine protein kinase/WD40 repeat protein
MTRPAWARVEELYHAVLEKQPAEREAFLDEACAKDDELRREVRSLLAHEREAERLMEEPAMGAATQRLAVVRGTRLGPYEIVDLIGVGGMGEVYRARDTRLGRDVAVKVLPSDIAADPERLRRFEKEARAIASLNHPHILTVHDVGSHEGRPYVVTELLEGENLREVLSRRTPTQRQVLGWAVRIAQGLAAAHAKGIVHRDLKPENLFLTADGRIKVLDFGLAKLTAGTDAGGAGVETPDATKPGLLLGTAAYMSPEQIRALPVDARSDLFSFGVVLYELLARRHPFRRETAPVTLSAILNETPPELGRLDASIPRAVDGIVRRCLEKDKEERFQSAHDLAVALEAVLAAKSGEAPLEEVEERSPYPGLASFTEKDAAVFFGREAEVAALWEKVHQKRLLAVIGPSGAGKTSFLRAGVLPARPAGWGAVHATPGANPALGLAHALAPELAGDPEAIRDLIDGVAELAETGGTGRVVSAARRWRARHAEVLLVADQLEELFTLSPPETQRRFAELLARLADDAGVHVVLSLRDDFLLRCFEQAPLAPSVTPLTIMLPLKRDALRRALVEPARKRGYRFEDEALVDEMVESVEGARGALPLLAFAVARLWEKRDRQKKLLTREAYEEIGGVAGALAQHAEAAMDRIGTERQAVVREILRNLVTAQGTRAVAEQEELLSAFPRRKEAEEVLRELIDARLVTSYEVEGAEGEPSHHRIEVVHESLLSAWPRLVRWQAQDEEGALLRDQLKQAAHLWADKDRPADLLWTGTSYREFELWRERYAGGLTTVEGDFARAMEERARRRKRLVTATVASVIVALAGIAVAIGISRQQAAKARDQAKTEAGRAEAGKLLALGRTEIDRYPTAALAYVRKSLELADTPEARRFAVEVLWRGPVARILSPDKMLGGPDQPENTDWGTPVFSPDGRWMVLENDATHRILLFPRDGGTPRSVPPPPDASVSALGFSAQSDVLVTGGSGQSLRFWSLPDLREVRRVELGGVESAGWFGAGKLVTMTRMAPGDRDRRMRSWSLPGGEGKALATVVGEGLAAADVDPEGPAFLYASGRSVYLRSLDAARDPTPRVVGSHAEAVSGVTFFPSGDRLVSVDASGEVRIWSRRSRASAPLRVLRGLGGVIGLLAVDPESTRLVRPERASSLHLWDLRDPPDAQPLVLKRPDVAYSAGGAFEAGGPWFASANSFSVALWPLASPWRRELPGLRPTTWRLAFTPDGRWLVSCTGGEPARLWPMSPAEGTAHALAPPEPCSAIATDPSSTHVLVTTYPDGSTPPASAWLHRIAGGPAVRLRTGWERGVRSWTAAFDAQGRRAASCPSSLQGFSDPKMRALRVWDVASGRGRTVSLAPFVDPSWGCDTVAFAPDGAVFVGGNGRVLRLVLPDDPTAAVSAETLYAAGRADFALSPDGRRLLVRGGRTPGAALYEELLLIDLTTHASRRITTHGHRLWSAVFDPSGRVIVSGDVDGVVRAGPVTGEEPHLLLGHATQVTALSVSPDGRWIASASDDAFNLWPMPDVTKPPLHALPHAELMRKLDALTNLRVVPDPSSATGWKLDVGPFPGWQDVPTW